MSLQLPSSLPDMQKELWLSILQAIDGSEPDLAFQVFLQALQGFKVSEDITFTAGATTIGASSVSNKLRMTLTENSAITVTDDLKDKDIELVITHSGGPWTLSWAGTDLGLVGAAGEVEFLTSDYDGTTRFFHRAGAADVEVTYA
jgi:hypothetical protein